MNQAIQKAFENAKELEQYLFSEANKEDFSNKPKDTNNLRLALFEYRMHSYYSFPNIT